MADIRDYFKSEPKKSHKPTVSPIRSSALQTVKQLNITPGKKITRNSELKEVRSRMRLSSSSESDGESPMTSSMKKEYKHVNENYQRKRRSAYISEDDNSCHAISPNAQRHYHPQQDTPNITDKPRRNPATQIALSSPNKNGYQEIPTKKGARPSAIATDSMGGVFPEAKKRRKTKDGPETSEFFNRKSADDNEMHILRNKTPQKSSPEVASISQHPKKTTATPKKRPPSVALVDDSVSQDLRHHKALSQDSTANQSRRSHSQLPSSSKHHQEKDDLHPSKPSSTQKKTTRSPAKIVKEPTTYALSEASWADKYRPTSIKQVLGQQTDKSPMNKILKWLNEWAMNNLGEGTNVKKVRPSPVQAQVDGSYFKAVLLSGPPGIGKTTCALLCCKELYLNYVHMNASDFRNKLGMEKHSGQLNTNQLEKYFNPVSATKPKIGKSVDGIDHVLIMDEVDGMSGNADRAGVAELIQMIKRTRIPIICICNDRQSTKIRSLANYCFDLRFQRPRVEQIKSILLTISSREKLNISRDIIDKIIEASNQDVRQCINSLQLVSGRHLLDEKLQKKDIAFNIFDVARQILSSDTGLMEKQELFFQDYSIIPLFVQENYLNVHSSGMSSRQQVHAIRRASEVIAFGDTIDRQIRTSGNWGLLVHQAMYSAVLPSLFMDGYLTSQLQFPGWFGKNSSTQKHRRMLRQISTHTYHRTSGNIDSIVCNYLGLFRNKMYRPLINNNPDGINEVVQFYCYYNLVRDDIDAINELGVWLNTSKKDIASTVSAKTKGALTRALNKERHRLPYGLPMAVTKGARKKAGAPAKTAAEGSDDENAADDELMAYDENNVPDLDI